MDSIQPGERWGDAIDWAIQASDRIFVFWCYHAAGSEEVRREYELALALGKVVVPVRLDGTKVPAQPPQIHAHDLRPFAEWFHAAPQSVHTDALVPSGETRRRALSLAAPLGLNVSRVTDGLRQLALFSLGRYPQIELLAS